MGKPTQGLQRPYFLRALALATLLSCLDCGQVRGDRIRFQRKRWDTRIVKDTPEQPVQE